MISNILTPSSPFLARKKKTHILIEVVPEKNLKSWINKQPEPIQNKSKNLGFNGKSGQIIIERDANGNPIKIYAGLSNPGSYFDFAHLAHSLQSKFPDDALKTASFGFASLQDKQINTACIGWGWACYKFEQLKAKQTVFPALLWPEKADRKSVQSHVEAVHILRDLVNMPANILGPDELEEAVKMLAKAHKAEMSVVKDKELLKQNFPLIYTVGQASPRRPRLIEMNWGNAKHPKLTLVGKGVVFDTGGLDLKPSAYMKLMKKDMGGAAHALALSKLIMDHHLPVRLKLLIPAVENAVGGAAFRPGDIIKSRKGLFVENTNTDAEGRLILADTLTYACEDSPELIIDFATLTGSARAALGPDIPAFFSNDEKVHDKIRKITLAADDPVWPMPLWQPYRKHIDKSTGDLMNSVSIPGDLIYSALFLESFIAHKTPWMHLDVFSWEQTGIPGRPAGAADTGMRGMFAYLQDRYG